MRPLDPLSSVRERLASDRGMAVPTVMLATIAAFALAGAALTASITAQGGSVRDQDTKTAFAAAEAGISNALVRYNRSPADIEAQPCAPLGAGVGFVEGGWCATPISGTIDRGSYTYWVRPIETAAIQIVSTGQVDGVQRRIDVEARSAQTTHPFGQHSVIGLDSVTMASNATIAGNVATNGDIGLSSNSHLICDEVQIGEGQQVTGSYTCSPPAHGLVQLPPVNQGDVATNNSNARITGAKMATPPPDSDTISGSKSNVVWNAAARTLKLESNVSLTLGGSNYSLCKLEMSSNSNLYIVAGATVRIYFDSPEACGYTSTTTQLDMHSNAKIESTGSVPGALALLFVGSDEIETRINLASNTQANGPCEHSFVIYAPRSDLELASNAHICGALAAKSIVAASNASVTTSNLATDFELPNTRPQYYTGYPGTFVECTTVPPAGATLPDAGC